MRVHSRIVSGLLVAAIGLAAGSALIAVRPIGAQTPPITLAVDADPSSPSTVETTRTVTGTAGFDIGINTTVDSTPYKGYQVELQWPDPGLDWAGTTVPTSTSPFQLCQTPNSSADGTTETLQDSCAKSSAGSVTYVGQDETVQLTCVSNGTFLIHMVTLAEDPAFGTTALDQFSSPIPTATQDATITCTGIGGGATSTPTPANTNTPLPTSTNTPVPTSTNTPVPTSTNTPLPTPTRTHTPAPTATNTTMPTTTNPSVPTAASTTTPLSTSTNTPVPTSTNTPVPTNTNTAVPTSTNTALPTATRTNTPLPTATNTAVPDVH